MAKKKENKAYGFKGKRKRLTEDLPPEWHANMGSKSPGTIKPGEVRNPLGQNASRWLLLKAVRSELAKVDETDPLERTNAELVAIALVRLAKKGTNDSVKAIAELRQLTEVSLRYNNGDNWRRRLEELGMSPNETLGMLEDALRARRDEAVRAAAEKRTEEALAGGDAESLVEGTLGRLDGGPEVEST